MAVAVSGTSSGSGLRVAGCWLVVDRILRTGDDVSKHRRMGGRVDGWIINGSVDAWIDGSMGRSMNDQWLGASTYVHTP